MSAPPTPATGVPDLSLPQIEPLTPAEQRDAEMQARADRFAEIVARQEEQAAADEAAAAAADVTESPPFLPREIVTPPPAPTAPTFSSPSFGPTDALTYRDVPDTGWGDTRPEPDDTTGIVLGAVVLAGLGVLAWLERRGFRRQMEIVMEFARRRAALVFCLGLGLFAADALVGGEITRNYVFWEDLHDDRWIALTGIAVALIGVYHWVTLPLRSNISD